VDTVTAQPGNNGIEGVAYGLGLSLGCVLAFVLFVLALVHEPGLTIATVLAFLMGRACRVGSDQG
jgi:hypothetical protein